MIRRLLDIVRCWVLPSGALLMPLNERGGMKGTVTVSVYDASQRDPDRPEGIDNPGKLIRQYVTENLITTLGLTEARKAFSDTGSRTPALGIETGDSATAPVIGDTGIIGSGVYVSAFTSTSTTVASATFKQFIPSTQGNGSTIREAVLQDSITTGGNAYSRVLVSPVIVKTTSLSVTISWVVTWANL